MRSQHLRCPKSIYDSNRVTGVHVPYRSRVWSKLLTSPYWQRPRCRCRKNVIPADHAQGMFLTELRRAVREAPGILSEGTRDGPMGQIVHPPVRITCLCETDSTFRAENRPIYTEGEADGIGDSPERNSSTRCRRGTDRTRGLRHDCPREPGTHLPAAACACARQR
jgi:hypothetical protein